MITVLEVSGVSNEGFDEAIRQALKEAGAGRKAQWFEVIEQKGRLLYGAEYQYIVKLKVGIEKADDLESCPNCHQPEYTGGHMCRMLNKESRVCEWCGKTVTDPWHLCKNMMPHIAFVCNGCGRIAVRSTDLCYPRLITS